VPRGPPEDITYTFTACSGSLGGRLGREAPGRDDGSEKTGNDGQRRAGGQRGGYAVARKAEVVMTCRVRVRVWR